MNTGSLLKHKLTNWFQSIVLLAGMVLLLATLGWLLGGMEFMLWAVVGSMIAALIGPKISPRLLLGMYRARQLSPYDAPQLYRLIRALAERAHLPSIPTLYYIPSQTLNAFTVGKQADAAIAITDGLLHKLALRELAGALAHEISHIQHNDMGVMILADLVGRMTHFLSLIVQLLILINLPLFLLTEKSISWFAVLLLIFAPAISSLLQLALSRVREFDADLGAVNLTGDPQGLASALAKLEQQQGGLLEHILIPGRRDPEPSLLRTHPRTEERISRLFSLSPPSLDKAFSIPTSAEDAFQLPPHFALVGRKPYWRITGLWH